MTINKCICFLGSARQKIGAQQRIRKLDQRNYMRHKIYLLITIHPPQFDLTIVGTRNNQRECGVEGGPVYPTIMSL